jgi:hypothetical protein
MPRSDSDALFTLHLLFLAAVAHFTARRLIVFMAKVQCKIEEIYIPNDYGTEIESVEATCDKCGHVTRCFGRSDRSRKRCLVLMNEECPECEDNYYVD